MPLSHSNHRQKSYISINSANLAALFKIEALGCSQNVNASFNDQYFSRLVSTALPMLGESTIRNQLGFLSRFFAITQGRGKTSLDVGCGVGHVLKVLSEFGYNA